MKKSKAYLSAVIITFNEENNIERCLDGLSKVADEIIVVDSYSTDSTPKICQNFSIQFYQRTYPGQIAQKQYALSLATYDHIIALDGDEALTDELIENILQEKEKGFPDSGYEFNRLSFYCGKWIRHGDWYPDYKLRLWNKHQATWAGRNPHDKVTLKTGSPKRLKGDLLHFTFESKAEHKAQIRKYAELSAETYANERVKGAALRMFISPLFYFIKNYIFKVGFLDGKLGWQIAYLSMKEKWMKYKILSAIQKK